MKGYEVAIVSSSRELTSRERIMLKDTSDAVKLDEATVAGRVVITPEVFVVLEIHNENAKKDQSKDFNNYVILDKDGTKYVTGSESFFSTFSDIHADMSGEEAGWSVTVYRKPSKNFTGKDFITCSLI